MIDAHDLLVADLKRHEGFSAFAYIDTVGKTTIGYGRNIHVGGRGITRPEAEYLLGNDAIDAMKDAASLVPLWVTIDSVRQAAIANLAFNLGRAGLGKFVKFLAAANTKDWPEAAKELKASKWYGQVGNRAREIVERIATGVVA